MSNPLRPEEKLRRVRLRAKSFFEQLDERETALVPTNTAVSESTRNSISAEQLNLFLRSLNVHLRGAIAEVQESSRYLADLAAEVRQVETRLGK
jgi:hypothetical protein